MGNNLEAVRQTLSTRDPDGLTVCIGGAALNLQLAGAGVAYEPTKDVDVLCPQDYFDNLVRDGPDLPGIKEFRVRVPWGSHKLRGAVSKFADVVPDPVTHPDLLPYTASVSISDLQSPLDYEMCSSQADELLVVINGIRCVRAGIGLLRLAVIGRDKDIVKIDSVVFSARAAGLITPVELRRIIAERNRAVARRRAVGLAEPADVAV